MSIFVRAEGPDRGQQEGNLRHRRGELADRKRRLLKEQVSEDRQERLKRGGRGMRLESLGERTEAFGGTPQVG